MSLDFGMRRFKMSNIEPARFPQIERATHPDLRAVVRRCDLHSELHTPSTERHLILPDAYVVLQFYSGDCWFADAEGELRPLPPVHVFGTRSAPGCMVARGMTRVAGVSLHRWRAARLLRMDHLEGVCTDVGAELQLLGRRVVRLLDEGGGEEALACIEAWLLARMPNDDGVQQAVDAAGLEIHATRGAVRIGDLATELGLSVRQLERRFKDAAGVSPKALARLIRFSEAHERLEHEPTMSLAALACELGYADQAHFYRDFRAFSGLTPGQFAHRIRSFPGAPNRAE